MNAKTFSARGALVVHCLALVLSFSTPAAAQNTECTAKQAADYNSPEAREERRRRRHERRASQPTTGESEEPSESPPTVQAGAATVSAPVTESVAEAPVVAAPVIAPVAAAPVAVPTNEEEEARTRFLQGVALARGGDCRGALSEFEVSLTLMERASTRFNIAQCQEELHRYDLAVRDYQRYLLAAAPEDPNRPIAEATLRALRNLLGTLHVESNVPAEVWLEDRIVGHAPGEVLVPGGHHAVELRADGYIAARREVDITARQTFSLSVTLEQAQTTIEQNIEQNISNNTNITVERPPLSPAVFWTGIALTGVAALAGGAFGTYALILNQDALALDPFQPRDTSQIADMALAADICFISAGVLGVGTLVMAFLTDWGGETPPTQSTSTTQTSALRLRSFAPRATVQANGALDFGASISGEFSL